MALAALAVLTLFSQPAFATPTTPSISNLSLSSDGSLADGKATICGTTTDITVTATVAAPTYSTTTTCVVADPSTSPPTRRLAAGTGTLVVMASDGVNSTALTCTNGNMGGTCTGTLPVRSPDDAYTVIITASATDNVTATPCGGGGSRTASANASKGYVVDKQAPTLVVQSLTTDPISQDNDQGIHTKIDDGSARPGTAGAGTGQPYTVMNTVTGPGPTSYSFTSSGLTFGGDGNGDGKAAPKNDTLNLHIPACAPLGTYAVFSQLKADDICGNENAYTVDASNNGDMMFEVTGVAPGVALNVVTSVVAELPPDGDYGTGQCFLSTDKLQKKKTIVNNYPGTVHITSTINLVDSCGGGGSLSYKPTIVKLYLPDDFSFSDTGNSPRSHVFIGPSDPGFDLHYPTNDPLWTEITALVSQGSDPGTMHTINFDTAAFNAAYPDGVAADQTIYIRAHAEYTGTAAASSAETFTFASQAFGKDADGNDLDSGSETFDVIANPTPEACVDGTLVDL